MLAGLKSEIAYVRGLLRVVKATKPVTAVPTKTIGDHLDEWVNRSGDRPALANEAESLTYRQLGARTNAYARWAISEGFGNGDCLALMMPNRPEYLAIWFGLARVGIAGRTWALAHYGPAATARRLLDLAGIPAWR